MLHIVTPGEKTTMNTLNMNTVNKVICVAPLAPVAAFMLCICLLSTCMVSTCAAQGQQKFRVNVPAHIGVTPPEDVTITHDESDRNQRFPVQLWGVKGNNPAGVAVSFSTTQAFTHTTDDTFKRNARLVLAIGDTSGPATWSLTQAKDTTDHTNGDGVATVAASSNGVGRADFRLKVRFITGAFGTFAAGEYETTITGTVTAH